MADNKTIFALEWDFRGLQSRQPAKAVACLQAGSSDIIWLGHSELFGFPQNQTLKFMSLACPAVDHQLARSLLEEKHIAVAIDAPWPFRSEYINFSKALLIPFQLLKRR